MSIGTSTAASIPFVAKHLQRLQPASILDVGCGWGRWGCLAREFLELWHHRWTPAEWTTYIVGIDINPGNWTPIHSYVYSETWTMDVRQYKPMRTFDLVIATDVLEHLPKRDGFATLAKMRCWGPTLVGVPLGPGWERGGFPDNEHEAHVSEWVPKDLPDSDDWLVTHTEDPLPYGLFLLPAMA